jgi:DNA-binding Xre family transcriptional regulator
MEISYGKLFKILVDRKLKKGDLCQMAGISRSTVSKLANGEVVTTEVLLKICKAMNCRTDDIMEVIEESPLGNDRYHMS